PSRSQPQPPLLLDRGDAGMLEPRPRPRGGCGAAAGTLLVLRRAAAPGRRPCRLWWFERGGGAVDAILGCDGVLTVEGDVPGGRVVGHPVVAVGGHLIQARGRDLLVDMPIRQ